MINPFSETNSNYQRWSPRGHILKSLASKVKSLALTSKLQVLENCIALGREQHYFWKRQNLAGENARNLAENLRRPFLFLFVFVVGDCLKIFFENHFLFSFGDHTKIFFSPFFQVHLRLCPWSLASASIIPFLGLVRVSPQKIGPWPQIFFCVIGLGLESCVLDSTSANYP